MTTAHLRFLDEHLLYLLARAAHVMATEFDPELRRHGINASTWRVLCCLGEGGQETVSGLAQLCLQQQPTMTKLLDRMERGGLVRRQPDPYDRRVVRVALTPRGEAATTVLMDAARRHEREVLARHPGAEVAGLKALLRAMGLPAPGATPRRHA